MKTDKDQGYLRAVDDPADIDTISPEEYESIKERNLEEYQMMLNLADSLVDYWEGRNIPCPITRMWYLQFMHIVKAKVDRHNDNTVL